MARSDLTPAIEIIEAVTEEVRQRGLESGHSSLSEAGLAVVDIEVAGRMTG